MNKYDIIFSAHDSKKGELIEIIRKYYSGLAGLKMAATESTAKYITKMTGFDIQLLADGESGGYLQIAKFLRSYDVKMIIFLFDPFSMHLNEIGINTFMKSCCIYNIPFANNMITSEFILERFFEKQYLAKDRFRELIAIN